MAVKVVSR